MSGTLTTLGSHVLQTAEALEAYDLIRHSEAQPLAMVSLGVNGGGVLDLSEELGLVAVALSGSTGAVTFVSGAGHDSLMASGFGDRLFAGAGVGNLQGNSGDDVLEGGAGADTIWGLEGADQLFGGDGDDELVGEGAMSLDGGAGDDDLARFPAEDVPQAGTIEGGEGVDSLDLTTGSLLGLRVTGVEILKVYGTIEATAEQLDGFDTILNGAADPAMLALRLTGPGAADLADEIGAQALTVTVQASGGRVATGAGDDLLYGAGGDDTLSGGAGHDTIFGDAGHDILDGGEGNDRIQDANGGRDVIRGGAGDDWITDWGVGGFHDAGVPLDIDAGRGNDVVEIEIEIEIEAGATAGRLLGGEGRDELDMAPGDISGMEVSGFEDFRIHGGLVKATAAQLEAFDTIRNGIRSAFVCHIEVVGAGSVDLSEELGSQGAYLFASILWLGNSLISGAGHDFLYGDLGADTLLGMGGNDALYGGAGHDLLDGGSGTNRLDGGAGDDLYVLRSLTDTVFENANAGLDTVQATVSHTLASGVENLVLTGAGANAATGNDLANRLTGNAAANTLLGLGGHDLLDGGAGGDTMEGGTGNDTYRVDNLHDVLVEAAGAGLDTVETVFSAQLQANFENLTLLNSVITGIGNTAANILTGNHVNNTLSGLEGNDTLIGLAGNDNLDGGAGDDRLDGGGGGDTMTGGAGRDTYLVDSTADQTLELSGERIDTVLTWVGGITLGAFLKNLTMQGAQALAAKGNIGANGMTGNEAANILQGQGGDDMLVGGAGADRLEGGQGTDTLTGGADADKFVFQAAGGADLVKDFQDNVDDLLFDDAIWGGGARSAAELMASATLTAAGAVFTFGGGNVITVAGVTNLALLADDVFSV